LTVSVLVHVVVLPVVEQEVEQVPALPVDAVSANKAPMHNNPNPLIRMLFFLRDAKTRSAPAQTVSLKYRFPDRTSAQLVPPSLGLVYHIFFFPG